MVHEIHLPILPWPFVHHCVAFFCRWTEIRRTILRTLAQESVVHACSSYPTPCPPCGRVVRYSQQHSAEGTELDILTSKPSRSAEAGARFSRVHRTLQKHFGASQEIRHDSALPSARVHEPRPTSFARIAHAQISPYPCVRFSRLFPFGYPVKTSRQSAGRIDDSAFQTAGELGSVNAPW